MPDAPIQEPPPAEIQPTVAPTGADPAATSNVIPENVSNLLRNLNLGPDEPAPEPKPKTEPAAGAEPAADPKAAKPAPKDGKSGADPATPPPADPGIRLRKQKIARPELPVVQPAAPVAPAKPEPYKPDPQWEAGLDEDKREMLADARFMEERFPDKYKGQLARTAKFLKDHAELSAREGFDEQSPEYKSWLDKNQPRLSRDQVREIEEVRVADRVKKEWEGKYNDLQHKIFVREQEPKIEREGQATFAELSNSALPDEIAQAIKKDGFEKANELYALEIETAQNVLSIATQDLVEFSRISTKDPETGRRLQEIVTDPSDPKFVQHQRLNEMVGNICEEFKNKAAAEQQLRNGKWFVTRDEWNTIRPDQRHRFWTFTNKEIISEAKKTVKTAVATAIEQRRASLKKFNWQPPAPKAAPAAPPPKADPPQPTNSPRIPAALPTPGATPDAMSAIDVRAARLAAQLNR